MKKSISLNIGERSLSKIAAILVVMLFFNFVAFDLFQISLLDKLTGAQIAQAAISDRDDLGSEGFWNFISRDLGGGCGYSVNTFNGNLIVKKSLFSIPGRGISLSEGLVYNSLSTQTGLFGPGWKLKSDMFVQESGDGSVVFKDEDGTNHRFTKNIDGTYKAPDGVFLKLTKGPEATTFTIKDKANAVYRFENGLLKSITDEKGNATTLSYDANNRITSMTDPSGRKLTYNYMGEYLDEIVDPSGRTIDISYDTQKRPWSVDGSDGRVLFDFSYNSAGRLSETRDGNGNYTTFFYDSNNRVNKINDARTSTKEYSTTFTYDTSLLKTTVTDPTNKSIVFTHNTAGNAIQIQNGAGVVQNIVWDKNKIVKGTDGNGETSVTYDSNGNIISVTDTLNSNTNATTSYQYDAFDNLISIVDPDNNAYEIKYDSESNALSSSNPKKEADANTYDDYGNKTSATNPGAPTYNMIQNGSFEQIVDGELKSWGSGPIGNPAVISVDTSTAMYGNLSAKISSSTSTTAWLLSEEVTITPGQKLTLSVLTKIDILSGPGGAVAGIEYYDANKQYLGSAHSNGYTGYGNTTLMATLDVPTNAAYGRVFLELHETSGTVWFDGVQLEASVFEPEGHTRTKFDYVENSSFENGSNNWNLGGVAGAASISSESPWAGTRSAKVNLTAQGDAYVKSANISVRPGEALTLSGFVKTVSLTGTGARIQVQYYNSTGSYLGFNAAAFQTGTKDYTRYAIAVTPPTGTAYAVVFGDVVASSGTAYFDNLKLVQRSTYTYTYDAAGNYRTAVTNPYGNKASFTYDSIGRLTTVVDPKGKTTKFAYDALDSLTTVTDALGKISRYGYDYMSRQLTYRDARSSSSTSDTYKTSFAYNKINQLTSVTDPLGRIVTNEYDDAGNLASVTWPNGNKNLYTYDAANRLSQRSYATELTKYTYTYDSAGNIKQVTDDKSQSYQYTYDKVNRLTNVADIFGYQLNYTLDKEGNVTVISDSNSKASSFTYGLTNQILALTDTSGRQTKFRYDEVGRPFEVIKGNGIKNTITYDDLGRVKQHEDPGHPNGHLYNYEYDANGNITKISWVGSFTYDSLNRLTSWTNESSETTTYAYDAVGNLTKKGSRTFSYNAANQIKNSGFAYDANGNLTSDAKLNYYYNSENQLIKVTKVADGSTVATYEYDYRGLRKSKTTTSGTIRYHWDSHGRLVRESDTNGNTIALYIYAGGGQLIAIEKGGQIYYTHTNHRGDILAITDTNGNQTATYEYGPWGEPLSKTGTFEQPFRYAGYLYDSETGLYYIKSRYYSPDLGRFLTKDAFRGFNNDPQTLNPYSYARNNPVTNVDLNGYFSYRANWMFVTFWLNNDDCRVAGSLADIGSGSGAIAGYFLGASPAGEIAILLAGALQVYAGVMSFYNKGNGIWIRVWLIPHFPRMQIGSIEPKKLKKAAAEELPSGGVSPATSSGGVSTAAPLENAYKIIDEAIREEPYVPGTGGGTVGFIPPSFTQIPGWEKILFGN